MPSQTFYHLPSAKQEKLIKSAMEEFANTPYPKVSINKIIQNAEIPRGSFYMYFNDKDDLFLYLINLYRNQLNQIVKEQLIRNQGNLEKSFISIYDEIVLKLNHFQYIGFFKNVFMFFNLNKEHFDTPGHMLYTEVKNIVNFENIRRLDKEFIFGIFIQHLFSSLALTLKIKKTTIII